MIFDLHCDTIMRVYQDDSQLKKNTYHIDIEKMKKGPSFAQFFAMFVDLKEERDPFVICNEMIDRFEKEITLNDSAIKHVKTPKDFNDKIAGIITIEEGGVLKGEMDNLIHFYNRGVRSITLTWNYENEIGYPNSKFIHQNDGLKPFGIELVKKMNELGMLIDVSHLSDEGFWDCIKYSKKPIIASHSNARGICNHSRNLTDEMIIALRDNGGIMGMNFCAAFLDGSNISKISSIVEHIKYIDNLAGLDVLAIGTDFDGIGGTLEVEDMSQMHLLKEALSAEGYSDEAIEKIFYKNAMRVFNTIDESI